MNASAGPELRHQIREALTPLLGLKLSIARNAASMKMLHFGDIRPHENGKGTVGEYALHIQCSWRIVASGESILTGSGDWCEPANPEEDWEKWNAERGTPSLDEKVIHDLLKGYDPGTGGYLNLTDQFAVEKVDGDIYGGFQIWLSGGFEIQAFPNGSSGEHWRFFRSCSDDPHFVVEGERLPS